MRTGAPAVSRPSTTLAVASRYGFRRIERVHVAASGVATVTGISHRYPRAVRVPLSVAVELITAGVPATVERRSA